MFEIAFGIILGFFGIIAIIRIMNSATMAVLMDLPAEMKSQKNAEKLVEIKPNQFRIR